MTTRAPNQDHTPDLDELRRLLERAADDVALFKCRSIGESFCREDYQARAHLLAAWGALPALLSDLQAVREENERLAKLVYVPGVTKCAKCGLRLVSSTLNANDGSVRANNEPQGCLNGCGPMWKVTERDAGNEVCDRLDEAEARTQSAEQRAEKAEAARAQLLERLAEETLAKNTARVELIRANQEIEEWRASAAGYGSDALAEKVLREQTEDERDRLAADAVKSLTEKVIAERERDEALAAKEKAEAERDGLRAEVEALRAAVSWLDPLFIEGIDAAELRKRVAFVHQDIARFEARALLSQGEGHD